MERCGDWGMIRHLGEGRGPKCLTPFPHSLSAGDTDSGRTLGQTDPRTAVCERPGCSCSCLGETGEVAVAIGAEVRRC